MGREKNKEMKLVFCLIVAVMFFSLYFSGISFASNDKEYSRNVLLYDQLDQSQTYWSKSWRMLTFKNFLNAQSFIPSLDTLTRVELLVAREGNPIDNLKVSIRDDLRGDDLTSGYIKKEDVKFHRNCTWVECDFPDISVEVGNTYYIVCSSDEPDKNEAYTWAVSTENVYPHGCRWYSPNGGISWTKAEDIDFCFKTYGMNINTPSKPERPSGPYIGKAGKSYSYSTSSVDPKGERIKYCFYWGDGNTTWTDFYDSGEKVECSHTWESEGNFTIKVKAQNEEGYESGWSDPLIISMPKSRDIYTMMCILEHFPFLKYIFEFIIS